MTVFLKLLCLDVSVTVILSTLDWGSCFWKQTQIQSYSDTTATVSVGGQQLSLRDWRIMCNPKGQDGWLWKAAQNKGDQSPVELLGLYI